MPKAGFYAVAKGRVPGIYPSWQDCEAQVKGFIGAKYKKFSVLREAEEFVGISSSSSAASGSVITPISRAPLIPVTKNSSSMRLAAESEEGYDVVYSDGACKGNGQSGSVAGIGVWWGHGDSRNIAERCPGAQTNNRAELIAIVRVLEETPLSGRPLMIKTDSTYSIKCLREWHQSWARNAWKTSTGKPVLNVSIIRYLLALIAYRRAHGNKVELVYVKGHAGIEGNEGADAMANEGARLGEVAERDWERERLRVEGELESGRIVDEVGAGEEEEEEMVELLDKSIQVEVMDEKERHWADAATAASELNLENAVVDAGPGTSALGVGAENSASSAVAATATPPPPQEKSTASTAEPEPEFEYDGYGYDDILDPEELERELAEA